MTDEKKFYLKDVITLTKLKYEDAVSGIKAVSPSFKLNGGLQTVIDFNVFKAICQKYAIEVEDDGHILIHKNTDGDVINFAPTNVAKPAKSSIGYHERSLAEFNTMKAKKIDPLKVKAELKQIPTSVELILELLPDMKLSKTILNEYLLHDINYIKGLFKDYTYVIVPVNLGKRIRVKIEEMFVKTYVTNTFNNKVIAFNGVDALHAFIINV